MCVIGINRQQKERPMANLKLTKKIADAATGTGKLQYIWDSEVNGFGLVITPAGCKSLILNYRNADHRARRKTIGKYGQFTIEQAREIARDLSYRIAKGEDPVEHEGILREQPTFRDVAERFMEEHSAVRNRPATHESNRQKLDSMLLPYFGNMKIRSISHRDVAEFMSKNKHRPTGANRAVGALSSMLSKAELWGYRDRNTNPCFGVEKYPENHRERFLSDEEFAALEAAMQDAERKLTESPYLLAMLRIMMHTGCRPGEAKHLKWEYIDLENKVIRLPKGATKEKRPKTLFVTPFIEQVLRGLKRIEGNPYVVVSEKCPGQPLTCTKKAWDRIKKAAGITTNLHMHDLRHSHASVANSLGYSLPMIGALLGHTQAQTTLRYAHLATDHLRKAAEDISAKIAAAKLPESSLPPAGERAQLRVVK
jgi:integrase